MGIMKRKQVTSAKQKMNGYNNNDNKKKRENKNECNCNENNKKITRNELIKYLAMWSSIVHLHDREEQL